MGYYAGSDSNGNIVGYYSDEINTVIPSTAIQITDEQWQECINNNGKYIIQNGSLVLAPPPTDEELLNQAKQQKISDLRSGYSQTLASGFNVTLGSTTYVLGCSTDDKTNLNATQTAVDRGYQTFPIYYADIHGNPIVLNNQTDLDNIEQEASKFLFAQHQQIMDLVSQTQNATDVAEVNAIVWTEAVY